MIVLTKRFKFSAAHRYHNPDWSEEKNLAIFGEDHRLHGHNYELDVSLSGPVNPETGYLADLEAVKSVVDKQVIAMLDHAHVEADIPWFSDRQPTSENMVQYIWEQLLPHLPEEVRLVRIRLYETATIYTDYDGRPSYSGQQGGPLEA